MESSHTWIIPETQVWVRHQDTFLVGTVSSRDEKTRSASCKLSPSGQSVSAPFTNIYQLSHTQKEYEDMCNMDVLNEPEILNNLKRRYKQDRIFTKIGPTLIVINPYKVIQPLFNHQKMKQLTNKVKASQRIDTLEPHVFLIAGTAYNKLRVGNRKQAIVISGESGAGKTENAKYCMAFLAALSHQHHEGEKKLAIQDKILDCNPILEAFGNSKTIRNSNSSRFGKYVRLYLDGMCSIKGAKIESYLLEKSRVVAVSQQERNFHVFYCLAVHPSRVQYGLQQTEKFEFLEQSACHTAEGINDKENFECVDDAFKKVGFTVDEIKKIWESVACILLLGNIKFDETAHLQNMNNSCTFSDKLLADRVTKLLRTPNIQKLLLEQKRTHGREQIISKMSKVQCENNRNTLAKALYNRIFDFIIEKMNERLSVHQDKYSSIGLLDIFGFENFEVNSFEQLCINFTNEKLQKLYTRYVFETELQEIKKDGLGDRVKDITPPDNRAVIELIESRKPAISIFSLIDDKTTLAMAKDQDIVMQMKKEFNDPKKLMHKYLITSMTSKTAFTIVHTQSNVTYNIEGFKTKNQDKVTSEIDASLDNIFPLTQSQDKKGKTIISKFDAQVRTLMDELESSEVHFVRCIKPNELKTKDLLDEAYTLKQIRYLGVLETIKIRKSTFPYRKPYKQFVETCSQIVNLNNSLKTIVDKAKYIVSKLFPGIEKQPNSYLMGLERIYFNNEYETKLNEIVLQKFKKKQEATVKIQRQFKAFKFRKIVLTNLKKIVTKLRKLKAIVLKKLLKTKKIYIQLYRQQTAKATKALKEKKLEEQRRRQREKEQRERQAKELMKKTDKMNKLKKLEGCLPKFVQVINKYQKFLFFSKLKYFKKEDILNQTIILNQTMYESVINGADYQKQLKLKQEQQMERNKPKPKKVEEMEFNQSFLDEKSILEAPNENIALKGEIRIDRYVKYPGLKKLRQIIDEMYKSEITNEDEYYSPPSKDCSFDINTVPSEIINKIVNFDYVTFFDNALRVRTTLFGRKKSCSETLIAKDTPITKSLMLLSPEEQKKSIDCFKLILRLSEEQRIQRVFKLVQQIIEVLQDSSQLLKNEIFAQFIKQQNTKSELSAIRIYQLMTIYVHIFKPDDAFIYSALNIFYSKLTIANPNKKENEYLQYLFPRLLKLVEPDFQHSVQYLPAQYQMMALMCKRQISMPIFFSVGNSIIIRVESTQTFLDIKESVMKEVGINTDRISKDLFGFFEIMNFQNEELQESPIDDSRNAWDLLTYWQRAKDKFEQGKIKPPLFIMMLKVRYAYECESQDQESIELFYAQCYFDLFIGRIKLDMPDIICAVATLRLINTDKNEDATSMIPMWVMQKIKQEEITQVIAIKEKELNKQRMATTELKFFFVKLCDHSKLCMAMSIPTQQQIQLFLRPKRIILAEKGVIHEEISIRKILKWSSDDDTLMLSISKDNDSKTIVIRTQYAQIVSKYLALAAKLIMRKLQ